MNPARKGDKLVDANLETVDTWKSGKKILDRVEMKVNYDAGNESMIYGSRVDSLCSIVAKDLRLERTDFRI